MRTTTLSLSYGRNDVITIDPSTLSHALRELHGRTVVNLVTGAVRWPEIIGVINQAGISGAVLANKVGVARSTVDRWHSGTQPGSFEIACRVLMVYVDARRSLAKQCSSDADSER